MVAKLTATLWKDVLTATSYRMGFLLQFVGPLFMILSFFFLSRLLENASLPALLPYGGDYFSFALVGVVFTTYTSIFLTTVVTNIRSGQTMGTLELILTTRTSLTTYLLGSSLYALVRSTVLVGVLLALGALAFQANFQGASVGVGSLVLALSIASMLGLGIISGSFILVFKQGDPLSLVVNSGAFLLSGVVYPVAVLPGWLQIGSMALPHTYALEALRLALLQGASLSEVAPQVGALVLFAAGILPLSILLFRLAVRRAKAEGSFSQY